LTGFKIEIVWYAIVKMTHRNTCVLWEYCVKKHDHEI